MSEFMLVLVTELHVLLAVVQELEHGLQWCVHVGIHFPRYHEESLQKSLIAQTCKREANIVKRKEPCWTKCLLKNIESIFPCPQQMYSGEVTDKKVQHGPLEFPVPKTLKMHDTSKMCTRWTFQSRLDDKFILSAELRHVFAIQGANAQAQSALDCEYAICSRPVWIGPQAILFSRCVLRQLGDTHWK